MSAPTIITITNANVKFAGDQAGLATAPDYQCQVSEASVNSTPNLQTVPATYCAPESQVPAATGYELALNWLQDWTKPGGGLSKFAYDNDAQLMWFSLSLNDSTDPLCTGQVWVVAGSYGGVAGVPLQSSVTWPCLGKPDIQTPAEVVATGATAGTPGTFTPAGATPAANLAAMTGITASPATVWAAGQYVACLDASHVHWDGTAWASGPALLQAEMATSGGKSK